ncbi:MAG: TlpA family protein disulfide reductase [Gammaproteobacteria bacterium]
MKIKLFLSVFLIFLGSTSWADQEPVKPFDIGSYQQLLASHAKQPFMLVIWSITCSSCLKEMELLGTLHEKWPGLKIVMLATDDESATAEIQAILDKNRLNDTENWVFASENTQKLRFEIDPRWYGELPRTYFFDAGHQREGVSGVLSQQDYETHFTKLGL